ncbi:MAG: hypothetical protein LVR00_00855 [Rhabdochlamydiaceae bacterium]|jgi:hypothetical protein
MERETLIAEISTRAAQGEYYNPICNHSNSWEFNPLEGKTAEWTRCSRVETFVRRFLSLFGLTLSPEQALTKYSWEAFEKELSCSTSPKPDEKFTKAMKPIFESSRSLADPLNPASYSITKICQRCLGIENRVEIQVGTAKRQLRVTHKENSWIIKNHGYGSWHFYPDNISPTAEYRNEGNKLYEVGNPKSTISVEVNADKWFWQQRTGPRSAIHLKEEDQLVATLLPEGDPNTRVLRDPQGVILAIAHATLGKKRAVREWSVNIINHPEGWNISVSSITLLFIKIIQCELASSFNLPYMQKKPNSVEALPINYKTEFWHRKARDIISALAVAFVFTVLRLEHRGARLTQTR